MNDDLDLEAMDDPAMDDPAPYGRRADGTPRGKPGPKPKTTGVPAPTVPGPRKRAGKRRPASPRSRAQVPGPDYRPAILGLLQLPAGALGMAALAAPNGPDGKPGETAIRLHADAATITVYGPVIAEALHQTAIDRPEVAALLERILTVGPYGAILAAVLPLVLQILCNHSLFPPGFMGTVRPEQIMQTVLNQQLAAAGL